MIIAYTVLILSLLITSVSVFTLVNGLKSNRAFTWNFWPFILGILISASSAQYIWG